METTLSHGETLLNLMLERNYSKGTIETLIYLGAFTNRQELYREALEFLNSGDRTEKDLHRWTQNKMNIILPR